MADISTFEEGLTAYEEASISLGQHFRGIPPIVGRRRDQILN